MTISMDIFRNGQRATDFTATAAMPIGADGTPCEGEVAARDGVVRVGPTQQPLGVSLLWDCGKFGRIALETTRVQPRARPHNLHIEMARGRLMRLWHRMEDWGLLDVPAAQKQVAAVRELQLELAEAILLAGDPAAAATAADAILARAMPLADEIALLNAELSLERRTSQPNYRGQVFGCRIDPSIRNQRLKDLFANHFDYAVVPLQWKQIQPEEDRFDTTALDEWVDHLIRRRVPIVAGPIIDFSDDAMPDWAFIWEHDFETLRDLMIDYVRKIALRYKRVFSVWNVVGALHATSLPGIGFEQTIELTRLLVAQVKAMVPNARMLVTIRDPFGEHRAGPTPGVPPMLYAEAVAQAGINCDGFGLEYECGVPRTGGWCRDLFQISSMFDRLGSAGKPVYVTALSAPSRNTPDPADRTEGQLDPSKAGQWLEPWSPAHQARWMESVVSIALGKPFVESVAWGDLSDTNASIPGGGLIDEMLRPKPAFDTFQRLRKHFARREKK